MKIWLLTHQRETFKKTNTGQLVQQLLADDCETIIWQRTQPDARLLELVKQNAIALLYPNIAANNAQLESPCVNAEHFVIIDSTWQQAQKMINQSPYLQTMPKLSLNADKASSYLLRRNQKDNGLCTAEVAIALLHQCDKKHKARELQLRFEQFNQRP